MQNSKTIYFTDYPHNGVKKSGLTVPFSEGDKKLFGLVQPLSSYSLRALIGHDTFSQLEFAAKEQSSPVSTYAKTRLGLALAGKLKRSTAKNSGLQATFRGGKGSPLHDWFPYLEGYSPDFVNKLLETYSPNARTVLDPFCGSGTSAMVAARSGRTGWYTEVNPACRHIIEAKAFALRLNEADKLNAFERLTELASSLSDELRQHRPDRKLRGSFLSAFGERPFFSDVSFDAVLRSRTMADKLSENELTVGRFFEVAILRSLVEGSLMLRRGDLRFKSEAELRKPSVSFTAALKASILIIASDLCDVETVEGSIECVGSNAKDLNALDDFSVDTIITSPPYLNGTNYFRNTKIELWFLRKLTSKKDLRQFRDEAITAGINDVTRSKSERIEGEWAPTNLRELVQDLDENCYDKRIALMVESYFREMHLVVKEWARVISKNGTVSVDLGDSCYSGIWVPTHDILKLLMEQEGFGRVDEVVLRERQSRDGRKLTQTVQVFRKATGNVVSLRPHSSKAATSKFPEWENFKNNLPHQSGEMAKRNWGHSLHSLCSYQGKLKPSIASTLVSALMPKSNGKLLDPFSGVGTIPFEARLAGHQAFGFDISPTAVSISRAKLETVSRMEIDNVLDSLEDWISKHKVSAKTIKSSGDIKFNGFLRDYFEPKTFLEILSARAYFQKFPPNDGSSAMVASAIMHILHGNRPYALSRRSHPITPFAPTGEFEYRGLLDRLKAKLERSLKSLDENNLVAGKSYDQDATAVWPNEVRGIDAIITSPPFFDSTRFYSANWMRLWFAGWNIEDFKHKPKEFVDERQKRDFDIYTPIFSQAAERLKIGGVMAIHLGRSRKCDMAEELIKIGSQHLRLIDQFDESVAHCESHGIRDKGTVTHHQYLLFQNG